MQFILDAIAATPPLDIAKFALIGAFAGAVFMPLIAFLGIKLNLKRLRTINEASGIPNSPRLFRIYSAFGAGIFAILLGSQPILDAAGENEIYIRAALLPVILILVGWPFVRALKRHRERGGRT